MPNPWTDCRDNLECAGKIAGFEFPVVLSNLQVRAMKDMIEVTYPLDEFRDVVVRKTTEDLYNKIDISGDYNNYPIIHKRLDKVMIENRDFEKLIKQYDFENAFFYCDPPYSKGCGYEVTSTEDFDHERLREILGNIKGRFLLSYDDSPKIRELYKGFEMIAIERQNGINNRQGDNRLNKVFKELLIANYPIREIHERQTDSNQNR